MLTEKTKAWLATSRFANLPTVWSNVFAALLIANQVFLSGLPEGYFHEYIDTPFLFHWSLFLSLPISASAIYIAGCLYGDAWDADFDREHRPNRPIPQGVLTVKEVFVAASTGLTAAFAFSTGKSPVLIPLIACVLLYARFHKRNATLALVLMSGCRFLLVSLGGYIVYSELGKQYPDSWSSLLSPILFYAGAVALYTVAIVLVARSESNTRAISKKNLLLLFMIGAPLALTYYSQNSLSTGFLILAAIFALWIGIAARHLIVAKSETAPPINKPAFVSKALAGFSLLDTALVASIDLKLTVIPLACFGLALLFQRIAPAT